MLYVALHCSKEKQSYGDSLLSLPTLIPFKNIYTIISWINLRMGTDVQVKSVLKIKFLAYFFHTF